MAERPGGAATPPPAGIAARGGGLHFPAASAPPSGGTGLAKRRSPSRVSPADYISQQAARRGANGGIAAAGPRCALGRVVRRGRQPAPESGPCVRRRSDLAGLSGRVSPLLPARLPLTRREDGCRTQGPQLLPLRGALLRPRTLLISPPRGGHTDRTGAGRGQRPPGRDSAARALAAW